MTKEILTQERLKELLHYNPDNGDFTWLVDRGTNKTKDCVAGYKVNLNGKLYVSIMIETKNYLAHRLAVLYMTGCFPEFEVDHENGNGLNNWWLNLKTVTHLVNMRNQRLRSNNKSGCNGVHWRSDIGKWRAYITINYKRIYLGYHIDMNDAIIARKKAEHEHGFHKNHGEIRDL